MKLYIPTCSLNITNIFSTESISPEAFYSERKFGIKRFYSLDYFENKNAIILFSKYPRYELNSESMENYSMVISIETEDYSEDYFSKVETELDGVDVYMCTKTIYLNPFNCYFIFSSINALQSVRFKGEQIIDNKFANLYDNNFVLRSGKPGSHPEDASVEDDDSFELDKVIERITIPACQYDCEKDFYIDKVRGFIYSYIIGVNSRISTELAVLYYLARILRNKFSAIVHSPDRQIKNLQKREIQQLIDEFHSIYDKKDEGRIFNNSLVADCLQKHLEECGSVIGLSDAVVLLKELDYYNDFYYRQAGLRDALDLAAFWGCIKSSDPASVYNRSVAKVQSCLNRLRQEENQSLEKCKFENLVKSDDAGVITICDSEFHTERFYSDVINMLITDGYQKTIEEYEVTEAQAIVFHGGSILKNIIGEDPDDRSKVGLDYLRMLNESLSENLSFEIETESPVLKSFAVFCQKHENVDILDDYLELCKVGDKRLAYGLLGARYGFSSLPKTFTSSLIDDDKAYYKSIFLPFYEFLHHHPLSNCEYPEKKAIESRVPETSDGAEVQPDEISGNDKEASTSNQQQDKEEITAESKAESPQTEYAVTSEEFPSQEDNSRGLETPNPSEEEVVAEADNASNEKDEIKDSQLQAEPTESNDSSNEVKVE